jgi:hypothetical protein
MSEWIRRLAEKYSEVNENQKAAMAKKLAKASASSEKGKAAVTLPKAPFEIPEDIPANERTAFHGAAAGAHKAGKTHFTFQGKKYPVTMKKDTAQAIADDVKEAKVDEISMSKMQAYGKAAAKDIDQKRNKVKAALDQPASPKKAQAGLDAMKGLTRRSKGSDMYVDKMTGRSKVKPTMENDDEVIMNPKKDKKEKVTDTTMAQESTIPPVYARIMEARGTADKDGKHYGKAADSEDWNEKEKNNKGAMDMKKDHEGPKMDDPEQSDQMTKAANAAPNAAARKGDNAAGDKKIIPSATPTKGM